MEILGENPGWLWFFKLLVNRYPASGKDLQHRLSGIGKLEGTP